MLIQVETELVQILKDISLFLQKSSVQRVDWRRMLNTCRSLQYHHGELILTKHVADVSTLVLNHTDKNITLWAFGSGLLSHTYGLLQSPVNRNEVIRPRN